MNIAQILIINFGSIDIIELNGGILMLLEVNNVVIMDNFSEITKNGRNIVKSIYTKVIDEIFK